MPALEGRCLCGDVAWTLTGPIEFLSHCHCGRCRKAHGTAFSSAVMAPADGVRFLRGRERIVAYESAPGNVRPFCDRCGSVVPSGLEWNGLTPVPIGALDDDPGVRPIAHIFVASKAPWFEITDAVPRFDAYPPGIDAPVFPDLVNPEPPTAGPRGSCLCGAVRFVVTGPILRAQHCHCSRCRRARAAVHASNCFTAVDGIEIVAGAERLRSYKVPDARFFGQVFCETCGSPMPRRDHDRGIAVVAMGSFDDDPGVRPTRHIFVGSKSPWYEITDGLPQFENAPPTA
jgi:hypothetical protein